MIKLYICCLVLINWSVEVGPDIDMKFHQEVIEIVSYDINNSKHFPIDQYLHDRVTPETLSPKPLAYDKPIDPAEMPHISTCTEMTTEDTNIPTQDNKYPWLDPDDK